jgi:hypothetical protein
MEFRSIVFVVTEECSCPLYNVGEEFSVQNSILSIDRDKPVCLLMVRELLKAMSGSKSMEQRISLQPQQKAKFECGGCTGLIRFEYKKERAYSTLQMNLLKAAEQRAKQQIIVQFFSILRDIPAQQNYHRGRRAGHKFLCRPFRQGGCGAKGQRDYS